MHSLPGAAALWQSPFHAIEIIGLLIENARVRGPYHSCYDRPARARIDASPIFWKDETDFWTF
jgi:hypothetical protein